MKNSYYAAFYRTPDRPEVGDRSVILLDGREREDTHHALAEAWAKQHGFCGYRLCFGTFTAPLRRTDYHAVG